MSDSPIFSHVDRNTNCLNVGFNISFIHISNTLLLLLLFVKYQIWWYNITLQECDIEQIDID